MVEYIINHTLDLLAYNNFINITLIVESPLGLSETTSASLFYTAPPAGVDGTVTVGAHVPPAHAVPPPLIIEDHVAIMPIDICAD